MTVAELLRRMSSAEITEWIALLDLEHDERQLHGLAEAASAGVQQRRRKMRKC